MRGIATALLELGSLLARIFDGIRAVIGAGNVLGWAVAAAIPIAYVALWLSVLHFAFSAALTWFIDSSPDIFGGSSFPSGALWLLNQTLPLSLMFSCAISLVGIELSMAGLVAVAITASRNLKS